MSVSKYRWTEECDTHICVGDCDFCDYNTEEEHETIEPMACPFCGEKDFDIEDENTYYFLLGRNGTACLNMRCKNCGVDMWEHTNRVKNYWERRNLLISKWNTRTYKVSIKSLE